MINLKPINLLGFSFLGLMLGYTIALPFDNIFFFISFIACGTAGGYAIGNQLPNFQCPRSRMILNIMDVFLVSMMLVSSYFYNLGVLDIITFIMLVALIGSCIFILEKQ